MSTESVDSEPSASDSLGALTPLSMAGVALAAVTGGIHLWLGVAGGKLGLLVAGVGFAVGVAAFVAGVGRGYVARLGIPFTAGQILLYLLAHRPLLDPVGVADKVVQALLVVVLVALVRRD